VAHRARFVVGVLFAIGGFSGVRAETIAFDLESRCVATDLTVTCDHVVAHRGEAAAENVSITTEIDGQMSSASLGPIEPGEARNVVLPFDTVDSGWRSLGVRTTLRYRDREGYPFSVVSFSTLDSDDGTSNLVVEAQPVVLDRLTEDLSVVVRNRGSTTVVGQITLFLPDEVTSTVEAVDVRLAHGESVEIRFTVRNVGAIAPSRYAGFAIAEVKSETARSIVFDEFGLSAAVPDGITERRRGWVLALLGVLFVVGLVNLRRERSRARDLRAWTVVLGLSILAYLLDHLRLDLLVLDTITTGGDTASHYWTAHYLRHELLPSGRLLGWMAGNLAGFPIFQLYFPLPFLLMMVLSLGMPLTIAFKWGTVVGTLGLPVSAYFGMRRLGFSRPVPAVAAVSTLPFLFQEGNSVWGGNLLSTLAGEFTYSFALTLVVLFVGHAFHALRGQSGVTACAVLLAAIGLSHAYALLFAAVWFVLVSVWFPQPVKTLGRVLLIGALAFGLIGFWILPLLGYSKYTSPYADLWHVEGWSQLFPPLLLPAVGIAGVVVIGWLRDAWVGRSLDPRLGGLLTAIVAAFLLNSVAHRIGVVDIRFLPFVQLFVGLVAAVGVGRSIRALRIPSIEALAPILLLITVAAVIDRTAERVPEWVHWNYSGFENRPGWKDFRAINEAVRGDVNDPRVVFEHAPHHNAAGSIRAFESLPYFSGRSTLEGLYIQSSLLTPEVFYLQSEVSSSGSCPLPDFHCTAFDADRAADHLRLFNASQVIARTEVVKERLRSSPDFVWESSRGPYDVFRVDGATGQYVEPVRLEPIEVDTVDWRETAFRWFGRATPRTPLLIQSERGVRATKDLNEVDRLLDDPARLISGVEAVRVESTLENHRIRISTNRPGHPLLVKVAYHPRWSSTTGEEIHLVTPGFMLVYPRGREIVLVFGETPISIAGKILTAGGILALVFVQLFKKRRVGKIRATEALVAPRYAAYALLALVGTVVIARPLLRSDFAPWRFDWGMAHYRADDFSAAVTEYDRAIAASPLSGAAVAARFYRGLSAYRAEDCPQVVRLFQEMSRQFPDSKYRAEAEFHIGLCQERLGEKGLAIMAHRALVEKHPASPWAERARRELGRLTDDHS